MKVLIVDDDRVYLAYAEMVLRELGYENLTLATSATEALKLIASSPSTFECFILDIRMPGMDGIALCARIRDMPQYQVTPIVMATAMSDRVHIDRAFATGASDYLTKPLDKVEVRARLGLVQELVRERLRSTYAVAHFERNLDTAPSCSFMHSIPLKSVDGAVDLFAMNNYLKTLGIFRAVTMCAVGVQVTNARCIYDLEGGAVFSEIMVDLAHCLSDSLSETNRMLSYVGGGTFVAIGERSNMFEEEDLSARLNGFLADFDSLYADLGILAPSISIGSVQNFRVNDLRSRNNLVDQAIASARNKAGQFILSA